MASPPDAATPPRRRRWRSAAFVYNNHWAWPGQLACVPFVLNTLGALAGEAETVHAHLWEPAAGVRPLVPGNVVVHEHEQPHAGRWKSLWLRAPKLYPPALRWRFAREKKHDIVFGAGQIGAFAASAASAASRCPWVYVNDEFPESSGQPAWIAREKAAAATAALTVVPDAVRAAPLFRQLGLAETTPFASLPNSPRVEEPLPAVDWPARLGLPRGKNFFLCAGALNDWMQVPELLASVPHWPEDAALILQSPRDRPAYARQIAHLLTPGRVFWHHAPLAEPELNSLTRFCRGSFALYRNVDDNMFYMGHSSGKLLRSLACGTPVIASAFPSLDFVTAHGLGAQVNHPAEIAGAVRALLDDEGARRRRCLDYFAVRCGFAAAWEKFLGVCDATLPRRDRS